MGIYLHFHTSLLCLIFSYAVQLIFGQLYIPQSSSIPLFFTFLTTTAHHGMLPISHHVRTCDQATDSSQASGIGESTVVSNASNVSLVSGVLCLGKSDSPPVGQVHEIGPKRQGS